MSALRVSAGELTSVVRIERREIVSDGMGNREGVYQSYLSGIPAKVRHVRGGEVVQQARRAAISNVDVFVRQDSDTLSIVAQDRLIDERAGTSYEILWVGDVEGDGQFLLLSCQSGGPNV